MSIAIQCPLCGQRYRVKDELAGKSVACRCGQTMQVGSHQTGGPSPGMVDPSLTAAFGGNPQTQQPFAAGPHAGLPPGMQSPFAAAGAARPASGDSNRVLLWTLCAGGGVVLVLIVGMVWMALARPTAGPATAGTATDSGSVAVATSPPSSVSPQTPASAAPMGQPAATSTSSTAPIALPSQPTVPGPGAPPAVSSPAPTIPTATIPAPTTPAPAPTAAEKTPQPAKAKAPEAPKLPEAVSLVVRLEERHGRDDIGVAEVHGFGVEPRTKYGTLFRKVKTPIILTALSACRRPKGDPVDLARVKSGHFTATANDQIFGKIKGAVALESFFPQGNGEGSDRSGDLAAFVVADNQPSFDTLRLATTPAKVGDTIWLVRATYVVNEDTPPVLQPAVVVAASEKGLVYELAGGAEAPERKSEGMPLVNAASEVVGIHSGRVDGRGNRGLANPAANVQRLLEQALDDVPKGLPQSKPPKKKQR